MSESTIQRDRIPNGHVRPSTQQIPQQSNIPQITTETTTLNSVSYAQYQLGISLSEGLKKAYDECKAKVERIAAQCRAKNRKFR